MIILSILMGASSFAQNENPNPGPRSVEQAEFLYQEGASAQSDGKVDLAISDFRKIIKTYPQSPKTMDVYQRLMSLYLQVKKPETVLAVGKEALLLHPDRAAFTQIQFLRAEAELQLGNAGQTKLIIDELLKTKPDTKTESTALLYKAEALSLLGKTADAFAALDSANAKTKLPDHSVELKVRARACSSRQPEKNQETLDYFRDKNLCFKETRSQAGKTPTADATQVWCDRFVGFTQELKKIKTDSFTREKIEKELAETSTLANPWKCK